MASNAPRPATRPQCPDARTGKSAMRRRVPAVDFSHEEPPQELLRFSPSQPAPIGLHGRPEPWRPIWEPEDFASFLRARAAWRDTHTKPLPGLPPLERHALARLDLPRAL